MFTEIDIISLKHTCLTYKSLAAIPQNKINQKKKKRKDAKENYEYLKLAH